MTDVALKHIRSGDELFQTKHSELSVKYEFYSRFFKENFSLRFGRPQINTCSKCEEKPSRIRQC